MPYFQTMACAVTLSLALTTAGFAGPATSTARASVDVTALQERPFAEIIRRHAEAEGVPLDLAHAVVSIESRYRPDVTGRAGEVGLMQIKPATARDLGYTGSLKALYDPDVNVRWGMKYLAGAQARGGGSLCGTILKYNAGHYAKRMNKVSKAYCRKVKAELGQA